MAALAREPLLQHRDQEAIAAAGQRHAARDGSQRGPPRVERHSDLSSAAAAATSAQHSPAGVGCPKGSLLAVVCEEAWRPWRLQ